MRHGHSPDEASLSHIGLILILDISHSGYAAEGTLLAAGNKSLRYRNQRGAYLSPGDQAALPVAA